MPPKEVSPTLSLSFLSPEIDEAPQILKEVTSFLLVREGRVNPTAWALLLGRNARLQRGPKTHQGTQNIAAKSEEVSLNP